MSSIEAIHNAASLEELSSHIEQFFSVEREWNTIHDQLSKGVPEDDIRFYNRESLIKFLLEFSASCRQTSISYIMKPTGIHFPGVYRPVTAMFENAAGLAGPFSREKAELEGWRELENMAFSGTKQAMLISPPSVGLKGFGDYGFLFYFSADETGRFKNTILRYKENDMLSTSRLLGHALNIKGIDAKGADPYLRSPIDVTHLDKKTLNAILSYVGYDEKDKQAEQIEYILLHDEKFKELFEEYSNMLMSEYPDFSALKKLLTKLYAESYKLVKTDNLLAGPPPIMRGGSCPISAMRMDYMPRYTDMDKYDTRLTSCPTCKKKLLITSTDARAKRISCPCGNSTDCPDAIYSASAHANSFDMETYDRVISSDSESGD